MVGIGVPWRRVALAVAVLAAIGCRPLDIIALVLGLIVGALALLALARAVARPLTQKGRPSRSGPV